MNNFQEFQARRTAGFVEASPRIKRKVDRTLEMFRFIGNIVDLYGPRAVDTMNFLLNNESSEHHNLPPQKEEE